MTASLHGGREEEGAEASCGSAVASARAPARTHDVVVLGAGLGGAVLALILARRGLRVAVVDRATHPRFAIGESTIAYTTQALAGMATLFGVPELHPRALTRAVGRRCGVKRNFGFVRHEEGQPADPGQTLMAWLDAPEFHFFRQDVDAHLFQLAVAAGADPRLGQEVRDLAVAEGDARVTLADGTTLRAAFLVDGTGHRSLVSERVGLTTSAEGLRTPTRSMFTHMVGVRPFDEILPATRTGMPGPFHQGTLHHVFDGGWVWVIPFDNHAASDNPLVSVGLQLDARRWPRDPGEPPEHTWATWLARFPDLERQLGGARAVRPWVVTDRLQYARSAATGPGFALLPHAYGFVDPLYSRGLACTLDGVKLLALDLLQAHADGDWSHARFAHLDEVCARLVQGHDDLAYGSLVSWRDWELWQGWFWIWMLSTASHFLQWQARQQADAGDDHLLRTLDHHPTAHIPGFGPFFRDAVDLMERVDRATLPVPRAREDLLALVRAQPFHYEPAFAWVRDHRHSIPPRMPRHALALGRFAWWVGREASPEVHDMVMPFVRGRAFRYADPRA
ncbi:MAG: tryptophan 7-halogenase [Alphaproteobacteria bacterium]|nr:tryptophan 7-halogenase [Alphaproteobacteria bacterium]